MTANVGRFDRIIRAVTGVVLLAFAFGYLGAGLTTVWAWVLGTAGFVLLATAILSVCPIYSVLGMRTCER